MYCIPIGGSHGKVGSLHSARPSSPWLLPITMHTVQMKIGQLRFVIMKDFLADIDVS